MDSDAPVAALWDDFRIPIRTVKKAAASESLSDGERGFLESFGGVWSLEHNESDLGRREDIRSSRAAIGIGVDAILMVRKGDRWLVAGTCFKFDRTRFEAFINGREGEQSGARAGERAGEVSRMGGEGVSAAKAELIRLVEEFFLHNYRDITSRKPIEWGDVTTDEDGNRSIRYKYYATIRDRETMIANQVFTFDAKGGVVSVKDVEGFPQKQALEPADASTQEGLIRLVADFFRKNYMDITSRETIEWGDMEKRENGNVSIRYKAHIVIRGKDRLIMNQVFTFDPKGGFVSAKNVEGFPAPDATPKAE